MNSSREKDSVEDEKPEERNKKYEDMGGFEGMIIEAWEGQKKADMIEEVARKRKLARKREPGQMAKEEAVEGGVANKGITVELVLIVMFLGLLTIGSWVLLIPFIELLQNPYSLPVYPGSSIGYMLCVIFPFYGIVCLPFTDPVSISLSMSLILPMKYLIVQSLSPTLKMQLIFYTLLGLLLVVLSAGLLKLKNWARIGTITYFIISLGYSILMLPLVNELNYALFNVNILVALVSFANENIYSVGAIILHIFLAIFVLVYLFGEGKHSFSTNNRPT